MADKRDFYDILGVSRSASQDEIQRAYRKLARSSHPDVNKQPGAEDRFKDIAEAYDVLSDPDVRKRYDAFGHDFRKVPEDMDPDAWARARSGSRGGGGFGGAQAGPGPEGVWFGSGGPGTATGFEDVDIEDLLGGMFGGRRQQRRGRGPVAGADHEAELVLTVEEAYRGGKRTITLQGPGGPRRFDVDIPPGVVDGQRIRLAGQGGEGSAGGATGDLYLVTRIAPHPRYRLEGRDIHVDLPLTPWEAALGTTAVIDTPGGEAKVRVNPGTSTGKRLRLRGRGMPRRSGAPGDLYAEVKVMVPHHLSEDERRLFEELARVSTFTPRGPG